MMCAVALSHVSSPLLTQGDKWELYIPSDLAYGDGGRPPKIMGGDCLIFTIEMLKIKGGRTPVFHREL